MRKIYIFMMIVFSICLVFVKMEDKVKSGDSEQKSNTEENEIQENKVPDPVDEYYREYEKIIVDLSQEKENKIDDFIKNNEFTAIYFYSPYCGKCFDFNNHFVAVAHNIAEDTDKIKFGKVNIKNEENIKKKYNIRGIPAVIYFKERNPDKYITYTGEQKRVKMERFFRNEINVIIGEIKESKKIESVLEGYDAVILHVNKPEENSNFLNLLKEPVYDEHRFYYCSMDFCKKYYSGELQKGDVFIISTFNKEPQLLKNPFSQNDLKEFINNNYTPNVNVLTPSNFFSTFHKKSLALIYYFDSKTTNLKEKEQVLNSLALRYKEKIKVITADINEQITHIVADYIKIPLIDSLFFHDNTKDKNLKYKFDLKGLDFSENNISLFIEQSLNGIVNPDLLSESEAEEEKRNSSSKKVKYLVGSRFKEVVENKNKDVLVLFFSEKCMGCSEARSSFELAAEKNEMVEFYEFNKELNDTDTLFTEINPSIIFFPAETNKTNKRKKFIRFDNYISEATISKFLGDFFKQYPRTQKREEKTDL